MNIHEATASYETWMRGCTTIVESQLRSKHERMKEDLFLFFRGTFYRWIQLWPEVCPDLCSAPTVLASADLHVGSFGTWRDAEGRLAWGIDDFDDSFPLPYSNDLVRLAASTKIVIDCENLSIKLRDACDAVLEGYERTLRDGGKPFVLAEREQNMEALGVDAFEPPVNFWKKLNGRPVVKHGFPLDAKRAIEKTLPGQNMNYKVVRREAGLGSLGQQRFAVIADWEGGFVAREAKAMLPSACVWLNGRVAHRQSYYQQAIKAAVRAHDPFQRIEGAWLIRRLSPESNPIEIDHLPKTRDEEMLLHAMGSEAANVHLGTKRAGSRILSDLRRKKSNWLRSAAKAMAKALERDWKDYKKS